jgi:hypothetical protein
MLSWEALTKDFAPVAVAKCRGSHEAMPRSPYCNRVSRSVSGVLAPWDSAGQCAWACLPDKRLHSEWAKSACAPPIVCPPSVLAKSTVR